MPVRMAAGAVALGSTTLAFALVACSSSTFDLPPPFEDPVMLPPRVEAGPDASWNEVEGAPGTPSVGGGQGASGDGGAKNEAGEAARPRNKYSLPLALDGLAVNVGGTTFTAYYQSSYFWGPDPSTPEEFVLSFSYSDSEPPYYFTTVVEVRALATGAGCRAGGNTLTYRNYEGSYSPSDTATCGLTITAVPRARGDRFSGTFSGTIRNYVTGKTKGATISFGFSRSG